MNGIEGGKYGGYISDSRRPLLPTGSQPLQMPVVLPTFAQHLRRAAGHSGSDGCDVVGGRVEEPSDGAALTVSGELCNEMSHGHMALGRMLYSTAQNVGSVSVDAPAFFDFGSLDLDRGPRLRESRETGSISSPVTMATHSFIPSAS